MMIAEATVSGAGARRKTVRKAAAVLLVLILLLVFFSKTIYYGMQPEVDAVGAVSKHLFQEISFGCLIEYSGIEDICAYGSWTVASVSVEANQDVPKGSVLATVNNEGILIEKKRMELEIEKLQDDLDRLRRTASRNGGLEVKTKELELESGKQEYDRYISESPVDGRIIANADCIIKRIYVAAGSICSKGQVMMELARKDSQMTARWSLSPDQAANVHIGTDVMINTASGATYFKVKSKTYSVDTGTYDYLIYIPPENAAGMQDGDIVTGLARQDYGKLGTVVPNSCIVRIKGGSYVYVLKRKTCILGHVWAVGRVRVKIVAGNDLESGLAKPIREAIVSYSGTPLEDGMRVRRK